MSRPRQLATDFTGLRIGHKGFSARRAGHGCLDWRAAPAPQSRRYGSLAAPAKRLYISPAYPIAVAAARADAMAPIV